MTLSSALPIPARLPIDRVGFLPNIHVSYLTILVYNWKHIFTKECLWPVIEQNFNLSKTYTYSEILVIDRKIREFDFGNLERESLRGNGKHPNPNVGLIMQRWLNKNCKDHGLCSAMSVNKRLTN